LTPSRSPRSWSGIPARGAPRFSAACLPERLAPAIPPGFTSRPLDENCWNGCVAAALGRAYVVSTDPVFLRAHQTVMTTLEGRVRSMSGTLGRQAGFEDETGPTFY